MHLVKKWEYKIFYVRHKLEYRLFRKQKHGVSCTIVCTSPLSQVCVSETLINLMYLTAFKKLNCLEHGKYSFIEMYSLEKLLYF